MVQSFGKICYLVSVQDRGEGGGPGVILGKLKYNTKFAKFSYHDILAQCVTFSKVFSEVVLWLIV